MPTSCIEFERAEILSQVAFLLNLLYFSLYPTHLKLRSGAGGGGLVTTAAVVATAATAAAAAAGG